MVTGIGAFVFKRISEQQLAELWWSDKTIEEICKVVGCSDTSMRDAWRILKKAKLIPDIARNHKYMDVTAARLAEEDSRSTNFDDFRPAEIKRDLLLEKLIEVHGSK